MTNKLIYTSYSPNTRAKDLLVNIGLLFFPWFATKGAYPLLIKQLFEQRFTSSVAYTFNYARSGMYVLFKSLNLSTHDEVIVQGFTCIAAINPIRWTGAKVIYCDIDANHFNFDIQKLRSLITSNTKVILFQHTFGNSSGIEEVRSICTEKNILLVEDCTNTIFGMHKDKLIGSFGDAAVFSFGRDKAISGVNGGLILLNNETVFDNFAKLYETLTYPNYWWTLRELLYPLIWAFIKFAYNWKIGKLVHYLATNMKLITRATSIIEKKGIMPSNFIHKLPNALACLAYIQLQNIEDINSHRIKINSLYNSSLLPANMQAGNILLRYPLLVERKTELLAFMRKSNVQHLGDWYDKPITPADIDLKELGYLPGMCPNSEVVCTKIINLPNHINITETDANKIILLLKEFYAKS